MDDDDDDLLSSTSFHFHLVKFENFLLFFFVHSILICGWGYGGPHGCMDQLLLFSGVQFLNCTPKFL
ncbi:hypothetical protein EUGRSUZ_K00841 [Eucalyptus grandis]|uniref:Transmembrane protein n=2 Tax=Eucalyptus grandis TaxID=71139 RepID=A0A058ZZY0_EUCGR|nr:hypothetical protein EUGRSUZ_K00841 [Eucalyptus grandis]